MYNKRTKIVCTIGPSSEIPEIIEEMAKAGMDACRLNFSHGNRSEKEEQIKTIRSVSEKLAKPIAIIADLQGPKLRLGLFEGERKIEKDEVVGFSVEPNEGQIPLEMDLSIVVDKAQRVFLRDGLVELVIEEVKDKTIIARARNSGSVSSKSGINLPDTILEDTPFTQKDEEDARFALDKGVDYLAVSLVQKARDLTRVKELIKEFNINTKLISKIEKPKAIDNLDEIIKNSDATMVARGDLAIEMSPSQVPILQQKIVKTTRQNQIPVIVATQMLESMVENPRPTRAEASDVANAVLNQVDAVMLSGESAIGKYPVESVKTMYSIIEEVESSPGYKHYIKIDWEKIPDDLIFYNAITSAASSLAYRIKAAVLAIATASGRTARLISAFRPDSALVAITSSYEIQNQLALVWGINPIVIESTKNSDEFWKKIADVLIEKNLSEKGQTVVMVGGSTVIGVSGATDTIKITKL